MATFFKDMFEPGPRKKSTEAKTSQRGTLIGRLSRQDQQMPVPATQNAVPSSVGPSFFREMFQTTDPSKSLSKADVEQLLCLPFQEQREVSSARSSGSFPATFNSSATTTSSALTNGVRLESDEALTSAALARAKALLRSYLTNHPSSRRRLQFLRHIQKGDTRTTSFDEARMLDDSTDHEDKVEPGQDYDLDSGFFESEFDPLTVALSGFQNDDPETSSFLMERISKYKEQSELVHHDLLSIVHENHASLVTGMRQVQQIDLELTRAGINAKNARRRLRLSRDSLLRGDLQVVGLYRRRARARQLLERLETMASLISRRSQVFDAANRDDVPTAVSICVQTMRELDEMAAPLPQALQELRSNMASALPNLRKRVDDTLRVVCKTFTNADAYKHIVLAYISLDKAIGEYLSEEYIARLRSTRGTLGKTSEGTRLDGVSGLAHRVQRCFVALVEQALKDEMIMLLRSAHELIALQKQTAVQPDKSNFVLKMDEQNDKAAAKSSDGETNSSTTTSSMNSKSPQILSVARASGLPLKDVCDQIPARVKMQPSFVHRLGSAFKRVCDLLKHYESIETWHVNFTQNRDVATKTVANVISSSSSSHQLSVVQSLEGVAETLAKNRRVVWGGVLSHIATVTKSPCSRFPALKLHSFERLITLLELLAIESEAFGGDTCFLEARAFIRETSKTYCKDFHADRMEALRSFLVREHWVNLGVSLDSLGGFDGLVFRGSAKLLIRSQSNDDESALFASLDEIKSRGQPPKSGHRKNPFENLAIDDYHLTSANNVEESSQSTFRQGSIANAKHLDSSGSKPVASIVLPDLQYSAAESQSKLLPSDSVNYGDQSCKQGDDANFVLTSTIVNCLAKDLGSSLLMMEHLPNIAADTFTSMCNLVWCYMYAVCTNFIPGSLLFQLFDKPKSCCGTRYAILRKCMERSRIILGLETRTINGSLTTSSSGSIQVAVTGPNSSSSSSSSISSTLGPGGHTTPSASSSSSFKMSFRSEGLLNRSVGSSGNPKDTRASLQGPSVSATLTESAIPARFSNLHNAEGLTNTLDALPTRIVAAESCRFVLQILHNIRPRVEASLPAVERVQVAGDAYQEFDTVCEDLRGLVHRGVARHLVNRFALDSSAPGQIYSTRAGPQMSGEQMESPMSATTMKSSTSSSPSPMPDRNLNAADVVPTATITSLILDTVQWHKIKTLASEPSNYVQKVILRMRKIWSHLQRECAEGTKFSMSAIPLVWSRALEEVMDQFLDAIASVEKCGTEGRALMSMDLATLFRGIVEIAPGLQEIIDPARQRVENYVKAFYYDRLKDVLEWITQNRHIYERWHLENLIRFGVGSSKSSSQLSKLMAEASPVIDSST